MVARPSVVVPRHLGLRRPIQPAPVIGRARTRSVVPVATWSIVAVLFAVWLAKLAVMGQVHGGRPIGFLSFGALPNVPVAGRGSPADWWRYVTAPLVHGSWLHVLGNCSALLLVGRHVERLYGRIVVLTTFVLAAAAGSFAWMAASSLGLSLSDQFSIGASGGVCGLIGLALMCGRVEGRNACGRLLRTVRREALLALGVIVGLSVMMSNVNDWAHAGGLGCGVLLGARVATLPCHGGRIRTGRERAVLLVVLALAVLALVMGALHLGGRLLQPGPP
jgi:membrane associated rhomboid family serine protease